VAPLGLGGIRGKKSTPSIGWEVPVMSRQSVSERARSTGCHSKQAIRELYALLFDRVEFSRP
jgi:hypothetical protein